MSVVEAEWLGHSSKLFLIHLVVAVLALLRGTSHAPCQAGSQKPMIVHTHWPDGTSCGNGKNLVENASYPGIVDGLFLPECYR